MPPFEFRPFTFVPVTFSCEFLEVGSGEEAVDATLETPRVTSSGAERVTRACLVVTDEDAVGHGVVDKVVERTRNLSNERVRVAGFSESDREGDVLLTSESRVGLGLRVLVP